MKVNCRFLLIIQYCFFVAMVICKLHGEEVWEKNAYISDGDWEEALPYLIPKDHPAYKKLNQIFKKQRGIHSKKTLKKAGFESIAQHCWNQIVVAKHPKLKGYILKTYLDAQTHIEEKSLLLRRVRAAEKIREAIIAFGYEEYMKVPKKWLYPLPEGPEVSSQGVRKNFLLLAEDMDIYDYGVNRRKWYTADSATLKRLYTMMTSLCLFDCVMISNIPFSRDGKIAFVDTEHCGDGVILHPKLLHYLNHPMRNYWMKLVETNGQCQ